MKPPLFLVLLAAFVLAGCTKTVVTVVTTVVKVDKKNSPESEYEQEIEGDIGSIDELEPHLPDWLMRAKLIPGTGDEETPEDDGDASP